MKQLVKSIQRDWQLAKAEAARQCEQQGDARTARMLRNCRLFKGTETLEELADLMFSPQGIEFMTRYRFPSLATFRRFAKYHPERVDIYIDAGKIALSNTRRAFLVGNTKAYIRCSAADMSHLYMMHGATADISARGFSVLKIEKDATATATIEADDHAKVLQ